METLSKAAESLTQTVSHTLFGTGGHNQPEKTDNNMQQQNASDSTTEVPTAGLGYSLHPNKPIITTTNESSTLTNESPQFANLGQGFYPPEDSTFYTHSGRQDTRISPEEVAAARKKAEEESSTTAAAPRYVPSQFSDTNADVGAHQQYGFEKLDDDGVRRTAEAIDLSSMTTEGYPRPKYVGNETSDDGIKRADGRDRVQFDNAEGSSGSLRPSLTTKVEDETGMSTATRSGSSMEFKDLGDTSAFTRGARIGTVQRNSAGTGMRDVIEQNKSDELGKAQIPQTGGLYNDPTSKDPTTSSRSTLQDAQGRKSPDHGTASAIPSQKAAEQQPGRREEIIGGKHEDNLARQSQDTHAKSHEILEGRHDDKTLQQDLPDTRDHTQSGITSTAPKQDTPSPTSQFGGPSSANEPSSQGGLPNPATTSPIEPMGRGLKTGTGGLAEPSVGAHPSSAAQPTPKQQGADRPMEEPKGEPAKGGSSKKGAAANQQGSQQEQPGHKYVRSTGLAAEGGDFDAARPGAGKEADRLLEEHGVYRTKNKTVSASELAGTIKHPLTSKLHPKKASHEEEEGKHGLIPHGKEHSGNHPHVMAGGAGGSTSGHESEHGSIGSAGSSGHKSLSEKVKEKLHIGHKA